MPLRLLKPGMDFDFGETTHQSVVADEMRAVRRLVANSGIYTYEGDQAPINIGVTANSRAINIQSQTDTEALGSFGNIYWITAAGERYATIVGNSNEGDRDIAIYTKGDPYGSGDTSLENRFQIKAFADQTEAHFYNLHVLTLRGDQPDLQFSPQVEGDTRIWFNNAAGSRQYAIRRVSANNTLRLTTLTGSGDALTINPDATMSFNGKATKRVVWDSGTSRPGSPTTGERFFDTSLGQPIWYDGTNWVDATGTTV